MDNKTTSSFSQEVLSLFKLKKTDRLWHMPVLAGLCIGIPLLAGLFFNNLRSGLLATLAGLVILYLPNTPVPNRMATLLVCSFGFMVSFTIGISFSFHPLLSSVVFGLFTVAVHWVALNFKVKPPGSFFFIMIASMASCMPFELYAIPQKVGLVGLGTMVACTLALAYSLLTARRYPQTSTATLSVLLARNSYSNFVEALIMGLFIFGSLLTGHLLELQNPYWVPISCLAVMQGVTRYQIWQRGLQRVLGTFIGLGLTWALLSVNSTPLTICISIILLQVIVEFLIVRNYAFAVIFITPMTILLSEAANPIIQTPDRLFYVRFLDIALGSFIGVAGGWVIHHEQLRQNAIKSIRKTRLMIRKR